MAFVVYHPGYRGYDFGPGHPFSPLRLAMLLDLLDALGVAPTPVLPMAVSREELLGVHTGAYIRQVEAASAGAPLPDAAAYGLGTPDVPVFDGMDDAARLLAGGTCLAARLLTSGTARRVLQLGGGLHHAQAAMASGFCVYNDLSLAIRRLTAAGLRVAYIDLDVHHGDGVQALHYADGRVLTISLHESGQYLYPGTGGIHEAGEGAGLGFKLNVPLEPNTLDASYLDVFDLVVPHALSWFQPDVLVCVCGADAHFRDPLADLLLTTHAYEALFRRLLALADEYAGGRALFTLAGGYDFDATVRTWALLYHVVADLPLPARLPAGWRDEWETRLGMALTPTLHDTPVHFTPPGAADVEAQNRLVARRLLDRVVRYWY